MHRRLGVLILVSLAVAAMPMTAAALGLDVEVKGGGGIGLGSTNNSSETGSPKLAGGGGVGVDLFVVNFGLVNLGFSAGAEYAYLSQGETINNFMGAPGLQFLGTPQYNFLYIPVAIVGSIPLGPINLVVHAGGFAGYFLSGKVSTITVGGGSQPDETLDSSNTPQWEYGLHLALGADIPIVKDVSVSPAVQLDWGLSNIDTAVGATEYDTVASLTLMVSIKYKAM